MLGREFTVRYEEGGSVSVLEGRKVLLTVTDFFPEFTYSLLYQRSVQFDSRALLERLVQTTRYGYTESGVYGRMQEEVRWGFTNAEKRTVARTIARRNQYVLKTFGKDILAVLCHNAERIVA